MRDQLVFKGGVMFYRWEDCLEYRFLLIVPDSLQAEVLHMNHDSRDSGHLGQRNTYLRTKKSFHWFRMNSSVPLCENMHKVLHKQKAQMWT